MASTMILLASLISAPAGNRDKEKARVSNKGGRGLGTELNLSEEQKDRRRKCKVPEELTFKTKHQIAAELIQGIWDSGMFPCRWVTCDTVFGNSPDFVGKLPNGLYYLAEVVHTTKVWIDPLPRSKSG